MNHIHQYQTIQETEEAVVEVCSGCKKRLVTKRKGGRIDNVAYLKEHEADFAQPTGPTSKVFQKLYGKK